MQGALDKLKNAGLANQVQSWVDPQQQNAQDVKIDKNTSDLTNDYTKTEVDDSQSAQDTEIAKKLNVSNELIMDFYRRLEPLGIVKKI